MATKFSIEAIFKAVDNMSAPVSRMQNRVNRMTRGMQNSLKGLNRTADNISGGFKKIAAAGTVAMVATGAAIWDVIKVGADFEQSLVSAAAKFPEQIRKGTAAYAELEAAAREVGKTTEFNASQSAQALNFLAMAGFNAKGAIAALPGVVDLATAANMDLAEATDITSDALGAFNLMSDDTVTLGKNLAHMNDVLSKTANTANTDVRLFFEAVKEAGPVAVTAGISLEQFAAMTGILASNSVKGSKAGTTMKNAILSLAAPTASTAKALKRLGIRTQDNAGNMRDVFDILGDLNKAMEGFGTAQKSAYTEAIFGKIPLAGVNILLKAGEKRLRDYTAGLKDSTNYNKQLADIMRDTVYGRLKGLGSAIESVKISIFSMTSGPLADLIDRMTEWTRKNEQLISTKIGEYLLWVADNFGMLVEKAKKIGIIIGIVFSLILALKIFIGVMTAVNLVMSANPVSLIIIGLAVLIGIIVLVVKNWDYLKQKFEAMPNAVKAAIFLMTGPIGWLAGAAYTVMQNWDGIKDFFIRLFDFIGNLFSTAFNYWIEKLGKLRDWIPFSDKIFGPAEVTGPQRRAAAATRESKSSAEVTIRPAEGTKAEVTRGRMGPGLTLLDSGAF